jgi:hypothetical protein
MSFNQLNDEEIELLNMLMEEAGEIITITTKILRHGMESYHPDTKVVNRDALVHELLDLLCIRSVLIDKDIVPSHSINLAERFKQKTRYTHHQIENNPYMRGARIVDLTNAQLIQAFKHYKKKEDACSEWGAAYGEYVKNRAMLGREMQGRGIATSCEPAAVAASDASSAS